MNLDLLTELLLMFLVICFNVVITRRKGKTLAASFGAEGIVHHYGGDLLYLMSWTLVLKLMAKLTTAKQL